MNFGALRVFALRALQLVQIEMISATFLKAVLGVNLGVIAYSLGGAVLIAYVIFDVLVIYPQEMAYGLKRNKEFQTLKRGESVQ